MSPVILRRTLVCIGIVVAVLVPAPLNFYYQGLAADVVVTALLALSLVLLTGLVGQVSFCQYSFAALGAFTVGSLVAGHGVSFWLAAPLGTLFAGAGGVLVGIPALRLRGLLLAVLTVAVALFVDVFLLTAGTWDGFTGGSAGWTDIGFPTLFGAQMNSYTFYLFAFAVFLLAVLLVWNLSRGKAGRVLRAVRDSEVASTTLGLNVAAWKLIAFGASAGLAGIAGALRAVADASVSGGSQSAYSFQYSVALVASVTVFGAGSIFSALLAGFFIIAAPPLLDLTPLSHQYFPLILGVLLILQLVLNPDGVVVKIERDMVHLLRSRMRRSAAPAASMSEAA